MDPRPPKLWSAGQSATPLPRQRVRNPLLKTKCVGNALKKVMGSFFVLWKEDSGRLGDKAGNQRSLRLILRTFMVRFQANGSHPSINPDPASAALRLGEDRSKIALLARSWVSSAGQVMQTVGWLNFNSSRKGNKNWQP